MDFFAELQKFYDQESSIHDHGMAMATGYWSGLYKQLPEGASVTQVLYASLPRIATSYVPGWAYATSSSRTRPLSHFYFRTLPAK
mgnify:CR=1 FL=1